MKWIRTLFVVLMLPATVWGTTTYIWNVPNGLWSVPGNWLPITGPPNATTDVATFDFASSAVPNTVTVDGFFTVNQLNFGNGQAGSIQPFTIARSSPNTLTMDGTSPSISVDATTVYTQTISCPLVLNQDLTINQNTVDAPLIISGAISDGSGPHGLIVNGPGTLFLSGNNTYTGATTIQIGLLQAGSTTAFGSGSNLVFNPTSNPVSLDLTGFSNTIGSLSGNGTVTSSSGAPPILTLTNGSNGGTFSGAIIDGNAPVGLTLSGGTFKVSGTNTYSGPTTIANVATLKGGVNTNTFSPNSNYTVTGTIDLNGKSNAIGSLSGAGGVTSSAAGSPVLTINNGSNGGTFSGAITDGSGIVGLNVFGGTLTLSGTGLNTYSGDTNVAQTGILRAGAINAFSSLSKHIVDNNTLDLNGVSQTIGSLWGGPDGLVTSNSNTGATPVLTINTGGTFEGIIADGLTTPTPDTVGITLVAGTQTLSGNNTYSGGTTVQTAATLRAGAENTFSPNAMGVTLTGSGTLDLNSFANEIYSLSGSGSVITGDLSGILTLTHGSTFSGGITGNGGINLTGGIFTLTGSGLNTYFGPTTIASGATLQGGVSTNTFSPNSDYTVTGTGTIDLNGKSNAIGSLSGSGSVLSSVAGSPVLTINKGSNGGTFSGVISNGAVGSTVGLTLKGGILTLTGVNTYTGGTTITSGTLALVGPGALWPTGAVTVNGVFDISQSTASPVQIGTLAGSSTAGSILLGSNQLVVTPTSSQTYSGDISGTGGSFELNGGFTLTLAGDNTYTGPTNVAVGTLQAGSPTAFSPSSAFTVASGATLDLNAASNTVYSLAGAGTVTSTAGPGPAILTITNGNGLTFTGQITQAAAPDVLGITLAGGSLTLMPTGTNDYRGTTTISGSGILNAGNTTALSSNSPFILSGSGQLNVNASNTIFSLSGSGNTAVNLASTTVLTVSSGGAYGGNISGNGGLTANGGTLILSGNNSYYGATNVSAGTLQAGSSTAFSANSDFTVAGTLDLHNFPNTINSLQGAGSVTTGGLAGILTIANGSGFSFSGGITGQGGVSLTSGTLTLTGSGLNTYSGPTKVFGTAILASGSGAPNTLSPNSPVTLFDQAQLMINNSNKIYSLSSGDDTTHVTIGNTFTLTLVNGGTFDGKITGGGALSLITGGVLQLNNAANSYTGGTTIGTGTTLQLIGAGQLAPTGFVDVIGTFDIQGVAASASIGDLTGSGKILLGNKELIVDPTSPDPVFSGTISGTGGSFTKEGSNTQTLSGTSSYTGPTDVAAGTLQAGSTTAFAPSSAFTVESGATLDLNRYSNTIYSLNGAGTVASNSGTGATPSLSVTNGGAFSGNIIDGSSDKLGLIVNGGLLNLSGNNTYSGPTKVNAGTLQAGSPTAFSSTSDYTVTSTLDLNNFNNKIKSLSGTGSVLTGTLAGGTLSVENGGSFSGGISGNGGLTLDGGTLLLSTATSANTYTGTTTINTGATLKAGNINAFSAPSSYVLNAGGTLDLDLYNNTIKSLESGFASSTVKLGSGILTINGGLTKMFDGSLVGLSGGLTLTNGSNLTLTNIGNTYGGPTSIVNGSLTIAAANALSHNTAVSISNNGALYLTSFPNSAVSVFNSGLLVDNGLLSLTTTYTQTSQGILDLGFNNATGDVGKITAPGGIMLDGELIVQRIGAISPESGFYILLDSGLANLTGAFSSFVPMGTFINTPFITYSPQQVILYFSGCNASWNIPGPGNWGDANNWLPTCAPGINGATNDVATLGNVGASSVTITLANADGTAPQDVNLAQLNFTGTTTDYTIVQYKGAGTMTFEVTGGPGNAQISVTGGSHIVEVPLILNSSTTLSLADGTMLTFNPPTSLVSKSTQIFQIKQTPALASGTGLLVNNTTLSPYGFTVNSASLQNNAAISPLNNMTIAADLGTTATVTNASPAAFMGPTANNGSFLIGGAGTTNVTNSGVFALMGPTGSNANMSITGSGTTTVTNSGASAEIGPFGLGGNLSIGGSGTILVTNSGAGAHFGPSGAGDNMVVGGTGTTTVVNNGPGSSFGPSGAGGNMTIQGPGTTTVTNTGLGVSLGPTGAGGSVTVAGGTINNTQGAIFHAGPGGTMNITGGLINNDLTSIVGSSTENINFTGGTLITSGDILAYDYNQTGSSVLQLNLIKTPTILGNVAATGTVNVSSTLVLNALPGSITSEGVVILLSADRGVTGTYSTVDFVNFPIGFIPQVVYLPNFIELELAPTITPNSNGSIGQVSLVSVNETNVRLQRELHELHRRVNKLKYDSICNACCLDDTKPSRVYAGVIDNLGSFKSKGLSQQGFDYNSIGCYVGFDRVIGDYGLGINADYAKLFADVDHDAGHLDAQILHLSGYAIWVPEMMNAFSVEGIIGGSYERYTTTRPSGLSTNLIDANGSTNGAEVDAFLGAEYMFSGCACENLPDDLIITPFANLQSIWVRIDGFKERDAGILNLQIDKQEITSLRSGLGSRFEYLIDCGCLSFKTELDLAWQYEFLDYSRCLTYSTINVDPQQVISNRIFGAGRSTFLLGLNFLTTISETVELEFNYDLQWNDLYTNHGFYLQAAFEF